MVKRHSYPDTWSIGTLEDICVPNGVVRGPFGGALKKEIFVPFGYKVYEQRNAIYQSVNIGSYYVNESKYREMSRFAVKSGDYIISCSGTIGRIYQIPLTFPKGIINQALLKLTINTEKINPTYFYKYFQWDKFQQKIIDDTQGGAMKNLVGMDVFKKAPIVLPEMKEQTAIAEALSDIDGLISSLQKLIEKKKAIKQGTMQELLTGKKRLPGFNEEWRTYKLGELGSFDKGCGISRAESNTGNFPAVRYGELYTKHTDYVKQYYSRISGDVAQTAKRVTFGDILFAASGETKEEIGVCAAIVDRRDIFADGDIVVFTPTTEINPIFLGTLLNMPFAQKQKSERGQGDAVVHIHADSLSEIIVSIPEKNEQEAIAAVIKDFNDAIEQLEKKLVKYQQIKQGMMQELLTGRIRLV